MPLPTNGACAQRRSCAKAWLPPAAVSCSAPYQYGAGVLAGELCITADSVGSKCLRARVSLRPALSKATSFRDWSGTPRGQATDSCVCWHAPVRDPHKAKCVHQPPAIVRKRASVEWKMGEVTCSELDAQEGNHCCSGVSRGGCHVANVERNGVSFARGNVLGK